jgi:hypothetical protein
MVRLNFKIYHSVDYTEDNYVIKEISKEFDDNMTLYDAEVDAIESTKVRDDYAITEDNCVEITWGNFFSNLIHEDMEITIPSEKLIDLENQFNISKETIIIYNNFPGKGAEMGRSNGIKFFFHYDEADIHQGTPHIHAKYSGDEIRINLNTLKVMDKPYGFKTPSKTDYALEMIKTNQKELLNYWNKVVINHESIKFKMTLY